MISFLFVTILLAQGSAPPQEKKIPVPESAELKEAERVIRDLFREDYAGRDPEKRKAFAQQLLNQAKETSDNLAACFVLLRDARDISTETGDLKTAFAAIDQMASRYEVDAETMKEETLATARKWARTIEQFSALARIAIQLAEAAFERKDFDRALRLAREAASLGRRARKKEIAASATEMTKVIPAMKQEHEEVQKAGLRLSVDPEDPEANLVLGRHLCFVKGEWEKGLPMLANGSDEKLKAAARRELDGPEGIQAEIQAGDAWEAVSKEERDKLCKAHLKDRARYWYEKARAAAKGITLLLIEKKIKNLPAGAHKAEITLDLGGGVKMEFVYIKPGVFIMGGMVDANPNSSWQGIEKPKHQVVITRGFYLGKYEVTQAQYEAVTGTNPSKFKGPDRPVELVNWPSAIGFCRLASSRTRRTFRLPTEAEWEYACRAGTTGPYSFGDDASRLGDHAWHRGNSGGQTHPVGKKKPNAWGLFDMHGNVWEWVSDWYGADYYKRSPKRDPKGPTSGTRRLLRGGSWFYDIGFRCRSAFRHHNLPERPYHTLGFRVVVTATP